MTAWREQAAIRLAGAVLAERVIAGAESIAGKGEAILVDVAGLACDLAETIAEVCCERYEHELTSVLNLYSHETTPATHCDRCGKARADCEVAK